MNVSTIQLKQPYYPINSDAEVVSMQNALNILIINQPLVCNATTSACILSSQQANTATNSFSRRHKGQRHVHSYLYSSPSRLNSKNKPLIKVNSINNFEAQNISKGLFQHPQSKSNLCQTKSSSSLFEQTNGNRAHAFENEEPIAKGNARLKFPGTIQNCLYTRKQKNFTGNIQLSPRSIGKPFNPICCNHPDSRAVNTVNGQFYCQVCSSNLISKGFQVSPVYHLDGVYLQCRIFYASLNKFQRELSERVDLLMKIPQYYEMETQKTSEFYRSLRDMLNQMENDHLQDLQQESEKMAEESEMVAKEWEKSIGDIRQICSKLQSILSCQGNPQMEQGMDSSEILLAVDDEESQFKVMKCLYQNQYENILLTHYHEDNLSQMLSKFDEMLAKLWSDIYDSSEKGGKTSISNIEKIYGNQNAIWNTKQKYCYPNKKTNNAQYDRHQQQCNPIKQLHRQFEPAKQVQPPKNAFRDLSRQLGDQGPFSPDFKNI